MTPKQEKKAPLKGAARRQAIADMVEKTERVDVNELAELFSVTIETVRRDLINLEENGLLGRVHGGAVLRSPSLLRLQAPSAMERAKLRIREKISIGQAALEYLPDGGVVLLDAGTTVLELARRIKPDLDLTIVSIGLPSALDLASRGNNSILTPGGEVNSRNFAVEGEWAIKNIQGLTSDVAFIGVSGVSIERGFTTSSHLDALMKQSILASTKKKIVLADSSKIDVVFTSKICEFTDIDTLITDSKIDQKTIKDLRKTGIEVRTA